MKRFLAKVLLTGLAVAACLPITLKADEPDQRLISRMKDTGLKYEVTKNGNIRIIIKLDDERTQLLFVNSSTEKFGGMEIREVWSIGYKGEMKASVMRNMLRRSEQLKLGAWGINKDEDCAFFTAKVPANLGSQELRKVIFLVGEAADELEKDVTGKDDL